jgi:hypothetical protein
LFFYQNQGAWPSVAFPIKPEEFADVVLMCLSNGYLNAEVIRLDGGVRLPPK